MKSATMPSFWSLYEQLDENTWSVRVTRGIRAVGKLKDDKVTWFWIGNHDEYEKFFG